MNEIIGLEPVDKVEVITLYENLVSQTVPSGGPVQRLRTSGSRVASSLLDGERRTPFVGGHGLSMLVNVTRNSITRSILFDAGGSVDGLVHNIDCLELSPKDWNCIVLSHGHWDHTMGLIGLHRRMGKLSFPLTLHPDAYLKRATVRGDRVSRLPPLSRQGLRDAGVELIETERPSHIVEGMALVTGQVERINDFEIGWPEHHAERDGVMEPDPLVCDDQGLIVNVREHGLVVLSGCGHAGIVNTVHYAQKVTGVQAVAAVIGGFHLGPTFFHNRIQKVVDSLVQLRAEVISPAHCSGHLVEYAVHQAQPEALVQNTVGTKITIGE